MHKVIALCLICSLFFISNTSITLASGEGEVVIVTDNSEVRIVEIFEEGQLHQFTYNKGDNYVLYNIIENGIIVETQLIEIPAVDNITSSSECAVMNARGLVIKETEIGFGYVVDEPTSYYKCPASFVERYDYANISIGVNNNTSLMTQLAFQRAVDDLIGIEADIERAQDGTITNAIMAAIFAGIGLTGVALTGAITSILGASEVSSLCEEAATITTDCKEYFDTLHSVRVWP